MYNVNDLVVYEGSGVCKVEDVRDMTFSDAAPKAYYVLRPLFSNDGTIYTPVGNNKVTLRPVITKAEAVEIIRHIPETEVCSFDGLRPVELENQYRKASASYCLKDMIPLIMAIHKKTRAVKRAGKKVSEVDGRYLKKLSDLINGELSIALGIAKDEVPKYIAEAVKKEKEKK